MAHAKAVLSMLGLSWIGARPCSGAGAFAPFAGLDELKPRPMAEFCDHEVSATEGGQRLRWCQHSLRRTLEDDGEVELGWRMRMDPDAVLSLDAEAAAEALACGPGWLELELPSERAERLAPGHLVLSSRFAHGCGHLADEQLYGRVRAVRRAAGKRGSPGAPSSRVRLDLEELPSFAHAVPNLAFHFSYTPAEARDVVKYPQMRTDYGANRGFLEKRRRLKGSVFFDNLMDKLKGLAHTEGVGVDSTDGGFTHGATGHATVSNKNNLLNFMPKKLSNFGWNWNFFMNTTESPNYDINLPGAHGLVKVRKPYIKMHAGIYLNFSSEFPGLTTTPKVQWTAGVRGHGYFQARVLAQLNTTASAKVDPFSTKTFQLPMLESLSAPQWFQKMDVALGSVPLSMEPGFQFNARMYHSGTFHGAMAMGGRTHGTFNPTLSFDSMKGFDARMQSELHDTDVWPPFWMIFTKRFELGVIFQPSVLMRGDFAGLKKSTIAIDMHPYLNITISRESENETEASEPQPERAAVAGAGGKHRQIPAVAPAMIPPAVGSQPDDGLRALTAYPLRVVGLNGTGTPRRYKVRTDIGGQTLETQPQLTWGQVNFHDRISRFSAGRVSREAATAEPLVVTLIGSQETPTGEIDEVLGWGEVRCTAFQDGVCATTPAVAHIKKGGAEIAAVDFAVLWDDSPELWIASQLRGAAVEFPEVILREGAVASGGADEHPQPLSLRFSHAGVSHAVPLVEGNGSELPTYSSPSVVELAPHFLADWRPCTLSQRSGAPGGKCEPTRVELYSGGSKVAAADLPQIDWSPQAAGSLQTGGFLAPGAGGQPLVLRAPVLMPLYATADGERSVAVVKMNVRAVSPTSATLFLSPGAGDLLEIGFQQNFEWTISGADEETEYEFNLTVLRPTGMTVDEAVSFVPDVSKLPSVQGQALAPVPGARYEVRQRCERRALNGLLPSESPCSFFQPLKFGEQHSPGEQVAVLLQWRQGAQSHELLSSAFELSMPPRGSVPRRLWNRDAWNERVGSYKSCAKKDLHFRLGAGMMVRGRIERLGLPEDFPALGNAGDEQPELSTGYKKVAAIKPGTDARDLLPEELCEGGLCKGALPGCTEASFEKKHWPVIKFNFNRKFHYKAGNKGKFHGLMKEALAYAFSTMPEALVVILDKVNGTKPQEPLTTTLPSALRSAEAQRMEPGPNAPTSPPSLVPLTGARTSTTKAPFYQRWWDGTQRRLLGRPHAGGENATDAAALHAADAGGADEEQHQATVHFKHGVPWVIDEALVDMMLHHGYFMEVDDDASHEHGPLRVTSVHVEGGGEVAQNKEGEQEPAEGAPPPPATQAGAGALAAGLGVVALLAAAALLPRGRPGRYEPAGTAPAPALGDELEGKGAE